MSKKSRKKLRIARLDSKPIEDKSPNLSITASSTTIVSPIKSRIRVSQVYAVKYHYVMKDLKHAIYIALPLFLVLILLSIIIR
jgi:hypothetical protein